ncbi:aspartyl/glutamyl-tRNA(Asn/Gln) amidotransferase subunit C [Sulfuritortus calidifontis]|uniref:Aspartyl/glutamyl-tRNA(Asn/Gln) amidotransferase subunit C n=1 Tax=Sulfuritortus calidifontis TaxID=1914471 RepID=A0A4R3JXH5_9PROT|nr:Asp-tRNA(Asn)/Glu-tRNA(Gln) amidotransferase subunit GatC [Sulfuritortus calidifontis]TCS72109.1 aspartyl/glutamyl-tRNA(Asn/Gln) amidotransferase subunit C [Sulfuritortus calidifontis]
MSLSHQDILRIARLARIRVTEAEAAQTGEQLNGIFRLIEQMQAVDTRGVTPMAHAQEVYQRLREDVVTETDRRAAFQAIAPQTEAGLYLVPKVIE